MYTHLLTLNNDTGYLLKELRINKLINLKGIHLEGKQLLAVNTCMYFRTDLWIFRPIIPYNFRKWNHLSKRKVYSPWQRSLMSVCMCTFMCARVCAHVHTCACLCVQVCVFMCVCAHTRACVYWLLQTLPDPSVETRHGRESRVRP